MIRYRVPSGSSLLVFILVGSCQQIDRPEQGGMPRPTWAQVRSAYTLAHPARRVSCEDDTDKLFSLDSPQNVLACIAGDDRLTLQCGRSTMDLHLEQYSKDYYHFKAYAGGREVGIVLRSPEENDRATPFYFLVNDAHLAATLGGFQEGQFTALDDSTFRPAVGQVLAQGPTQGATAYFAPTALNNKGCFLQQLGYSTEANLFFQEVVRRYPTRAVAYLNRGDTYWQLGQPAAAQTDYRRYVWLLRTQHKDTTRVPAYVWLALRLPIR
jgi:tetratricopeptide (TPR) repeat protein